jgi:hypothetical protein
VVDFAITDGPAAILVGILRRHYALSPAAIDRAAHLDFEGESGTIPSWAAVLRGEKPSSLIEQLSFITFPGEERETKYYGPLFLGVLFAAMGIWGVMSMLRGLINQ